MLVHVPSPFPDLAHTLERPGNISGDFAQKY